MSERSFKYGGEEILTTLILIAFAVALTAYSWYRDKGKTRRGIGMAKRQFLGTVGQIGAILALVGWVLALIPESYIRAVMGGSSAVLSTVFGALIGTVTILPAFVAFPLAASLIERGAHVISVAAFVTTLTMVGFATFPIEVRHFGMRFTLLRNGASFVAALLIAIGMVIVL